MTINMGNQKSIKSKPATLMLSGTHRFRAVHVRFQDPLQLHHGSNDTELVRDILQVDIPILGKGNDHHHHHQVMT